MAMERKIVVNQLGSPFSAVQWPPISTERQEEILELICHLLAPIGHRRSQITSSKGKRKRKRARKGASKRQTDAAATDAVTASVTSTVPPMPELAAYVDIGLSRICRNLQDMSRRKPSEAKPSPPDQQAGYSVVFVSRASKSSAFGSHFPQMLALASRSSEKPVRLVGFSSKACEDRLAAALGIPRVSSLALREGAPQAKGLLDFLQDHVPPVEVIWLDEARRGEYLATNIESIQTKVGPKVKKTGVEKGS